MEDQMSSLPSLWVSWVLLFWIFLLLLVRFSFYVLRSSLFLRWWLWSLWHLPLQLILVVGCLCCCCVLRLGSTPTWTGGNLPKLLIPDPARTWWPLHHSWSSRDPGIRLYTYDSCVLIATLFWVSSGIGTTPKNSHDHESTSPLSFLLLLNWSFSVDSGALVLPTWLSKLVLMAEVIEDPFGRLIFSILSNTY